MRTPDRANGVLRRCLSRLVDEQPADRLPAQASEHAADGREGRGDQGHDQEEQLPGGAQLLRFQVAGIASRDDITGSAESVFHLACRISQEVLVELKRGEEQLRAGSVDLGVKPGRVEFTLVAGPGLVRVAGRITLTVPGALGT